MATIISIAPYKFLPPANGGHWGIVITERILSVFNTVHTVTTDDNVVRKTYPFRVHPVMKATKLRYLPYLQYRVLRRIAVTEGADYIFCHHHYLYPAARMLANRLGIPLYIRCHNIEAERFRSTGKWWWKAMRAFERKAFRGADAVFFVTGEDRDWAVSRYGLEPAKAIVMPFGIDFNAVPPLQRDRTTLSAQYGLNPEVPWLFFMGQLDYAPNAEAVAIILTHLFPLMKEHLQRFHILLCGKGLSTVLQEQIKAVAEENNICYLGFVPEIEPLIAACDLMLNPVISGGGVKTKVVESLAWNKTVVSAHSGAIGIEKQVCGDKLLEVADGDWEGFVRQVGNALAHPDKDIPAAYFDYYYSENIAGRMQAYFQAPPEQ